MSDELPPANLPMLLVNAQYLKDLSFEVPGAPTIYAELATQPPEISVRVDLNAQPMHENRFEVTLTLSVDATVEGKVAFIVEVAYAGVFTVNVAPEHVQQVLLIECPRLLFPFARSIIANATQDGSFPPLLLQPIDFLALYQARAEQAAAAEPGTNTVN
jgi:preprotein translocase subunit SecB